jgi:hypothetical protein
MPRSACWGTTKTSILQSDSLLFFAFAFSAARDMPGSVEESGRQDECNGSLMDRYINRTSHLPGCKPQARTARSSSAKSCFDHARPTDSTLDAFELLHSVHAQQQCQSSIGGVPSRVAVHSHRPSTMEHNSSDDSTSEELYNVVDRSASRSTACLISAVVSLLCIERGCLVVIDAAVA